MVYLICHTQLLGPYTTLIMSTFQFFYFYFSLRNIYRERYLRGYFDWIWVKLHPQCGKLDLHSSICRHNMFAKILGLCLLFSLCFASLGLPSPRFWFNDLCFHTKWAYAMAPPSAREALHCYSLLTSSMTPFQKLALSFLGHMLRLNT